jgi:prophage maintenance system killer protein
MPAPRIVHVVRTTITIRHSLPDMFNTAADYTTSIIKP